MKKRMCVERGFGLFVMTIVVMAVVLMALFAAAVPRAAGIPRSPLASSTPGYFDYMPLIQCDTCPTGTPTATSRPTLPAPTDTATPIPTATPTARPTLPAPGV